MIAHFPSILRFPQQFPYYYGQDPSECLGLKILKNVLKKESTNDDENVQLFKYLAPFIYKLPEIFTAFLVIWAALWKKSVTCIKSESFSPLDVKAGVPDY